MKDLVYLGSSPVDELCVQVGSPDYDFRAEVECRRYIETIRKQFGPEPEGAELKIKWALHEFGRYAEVVCEFDDSNAKATEYAFKIEDDLPKTWEG